MKRQMQKQTASISVIIPCFRCEDTLQRALNSVKAQTISPKEIILINDGNTPSTSEGIKTICGDLESTAFKIRIIHLEHNNGPGFARNKGWRLSDSEYLAFLDADDIWHPQKLEIQYGWMKQRPDVILTGHQSMEIKNGHGSHSMDLPKQWRAHQVMPSVQLLSNRFHTRTVMVRKDVPQRFVTTRRYSEDYQLWLEIVLSHLSAWRLEIPLAFTFKAQYGATGLSGKLWEMEKGEVSSYLGIYRKKLIPFSVLLALIPISAFKFLRRVLISWYRNRVGI